MTAPRVHRPDAGVEIATDPILSAFTPLVDRLYCQLDARTNAIARVTGQLDYWLEDHPVEEIPEKLKVGLVTMCETLQAGLVYGPRPGNAR